MKKRTFIKNTSLLVGSMAAVPAVLLESCAPKEKKDESADAAISSEAITEFELPELPYEFAALVPTIDAMTMEIHHGKHHAGYVRKLNIALNDYSEKFESLEGLLTKPDLPTGVRNNGGGHFNHSLFWTSLKAGGSNPTADFEKAIKSNFGSMDELKKALIDGGKSVFGSGWVWLIRNKSGQMEVTTTPNQDNPLMETASVNGFPLFGIDVWEHAYYLNYQNMRGEYLEKIFDVVDWQTVSSRLA